ncbi:hypothetical protein, partial [Rhizobium leguminosarum]|uniref:hypothetical protein n=1 Tax=Rhizobium leguminosarum TaxID=384 RepID=UPI0013BD1339
IAATTPRQGRRKGPWADALKKANPDLSAKDAARIVDAATNIISRRAAFQVVSAQEQARLDKIAATTPRQERSKGAWADALKRANPDLSAKDAARIVDAITTDIARRPTFQVVSAQEQARLDKIAATTPQQGLSKGDWADALKKANPGLSAKDAARIVDARQDEIAKLAAFRVVSAQEQARLDKIAATAPQQGRRKGPWADALKRANPDLSAKDAARIVNGKTDNIAKRPAFQVVSAQEQARLDKIAATAPRQGRRKGPWADALKKANPGLSAKDAARIVGTATNTIAIRPAFQVVSAQEQARLDKIAAATPQQGRRKGVWADALKNANPGLSAKDAARIVNRKTENIAIRPAFQVVSAQEQARLDEIAATTPQQGLSKGVWADALKKANPGLSAKDAARIVGTATNTIAIRPAFQVVSAQEQARLDKIAAATPQQGRRKGVWADALKNANPGLSAKDAARIVNRKTENIAIRPAFQVVSAQEQARLDEIAATTPQQGLSKGVWADALKKANPGLSAKDAARIVGTATNTIAIRPAFQVVSAQEQARLDKIAATAPQQGRRKGPWADALKKANPGLSAKDAARIVDAITEKIARRPAFQVVSAQEQARLDEIAAATPQQGRRKGPWADALKKANPGLSAKDIARIVSTTTSTIVREAGAMLEFGTCDEFRQLILSFQSSPRPGGGDDQLEDQRGGLRG